MVNVAKCEGSGPLNVASTESMPESGRCNTAGGVNVASSEGTPEFGRWKTAGVPMPAFLRSFAMQPSPRSSKFDCTSSLVRFRRFIAYMQWSLTSDYLTVRPKKKRHKFK